MRSRCLQRLRTGPYPAQAHAGCMDYVLGVQLPGPGDCCVTNRNTPDLIAFALNGIATFASNRSGDSRSEEQVVVRSVDDGIHNHLGYVALLNDNSFAN